MDLSQLLTKELHSTSLLIDSVVIQFYELDNLIYTSLLLLRFQPNTLAYITPTPLCIKATYVCL